MVSGVMLSKKFSTLGWSLRPAKQGVIPALGEDADAAGAGVLSPVHAARREVAGRGTTIDAFLASSSGVAASVAIAGPSCSVYLQ
jgi:hypothetical protein